MDINLKMDRKIDFEIQHKKTKESKDMPEAHYHPYYEIGYLVTGTRKSFVDHTVYMLSEGDLHIIRKNAIHRSLAAKPGGWNGITCFFSEDYLKPLYNTYGEEKINAIIDKQIWHFEGKVKRQLETFLHSMISTYRRPSTYIHREQQIFIEMLFIQLLKRAETGEKLPFIAQDIENHTMQQAAKYISSHFDKELTLGEVAAKFDMSPSYFSKRFKAITGFSFKEYLIMIRIKEACALLIQSNIPITEIALKCGFSDSNYFGDAFKKVKGVSPRNYRKVSGFI